jgi:antitoxin (DNA-binding transcriptional repressor) of toxin-antitoxin stability system
MLVHHACYANQYSRGTGTPFPADRQGSRREEITIANDGVPAVRLVPVRPTEGKRKLGLYRDEIWIADDFDAPLPPDLLAGFLGEDSASEATDDNPDLKDKAKRRKKKWSTCSTRVFTFIMLAVGDLPRHHNDPFDRILIAKARMERMVLMTADSLFSKYPVQTLWCAA